MEKEKVLDIEIIKINDNYSAWYITYQNEEILKRGKFKDDDLEVYSDVCPSFLLGLFFLKGEDKSLDDDVKIISNENVELLKEKVKKINEKYGVQKK